MTAVLSFIGITKTTRNITAINKSISKNVISVQPGTLVIISVVVPRELQIDAPSCSAA